MKVMTAIERCRTAALGGHVARCENEKCAHTVIAYNSCRNRHCPKCQGAAAREWLAEREAELLPVPYFHVVYTLPAPIADIAYQNKAVIYDLLFKASAETTLTIAADPKHLGARIGFISVLHTWGSALTHHPHVHMVVPGGGLSPDGSKLDRLPAALFSDRGGSLGVCSAGCFWRCWSPRIDAGACSSSAIMRGSPTRLRSRPIWRHCARSIGWSTPRSRSPDPSKCCAILSRYTHRVAISNRRLISADENGVTFKYKDYRIDGPSRYKTMTLDDRRVHPPLPDPRPAEGLPSHPPLRPARQRQPRRKHRARPRAARRAARPKEPETARSRAIDEPRVLPRPCPCCGGRMIIIETFARGCSRSTVPRRLRQRSGSTPHDAAPPIHHCSIRIILAGFAAGTRPSSHRCCRFASSSHAQILSLQSAPSPVHTHSRTCRAANDRRTRCQFHPITPEPAAKSP